MMQFQTMHFGKKKNKITLIHMNKPLVNGLAGMITSPLFEDNIAIIVSEITDDYDFACLACAENGAVPRVMMTKDVYYDIKRGKPYARMILFHELGHYYHNDLSVHNENRNSERERLVLEGKVSDEELRADAFAVRYLSKDIVICGLEKLKNLVSSKYADFPKESINTIINEINLRIKSIIF